MTIWNKSLLLACVLMQWLAAAGNAQTYTILKSFGGAPGAPGGLPHGKMAQAADGTLYGLNTVSDGGDGTVFKIRPDGSGYTILKSFTNYVAEGSGAYGGLWLDGQTLYGTRSSGGATGQPGQSYAGKGVLFKINTDGSGFTVLKHFGGADGETPYGRPLVVEGVVYGTTYYGGTNGIGPGTPAGTVYRVNTDGSDFAILKHFGAADGEASGAGPQAGLVCIGGYLYGTTSGGGGGSSGNGNVFAIGTNGLGFEVLQSFSYGNSLGATPEAGLTLAGGKLYGVTSTSSSGSGKIFRFNPDGSGFGIVATVPTAVGAPTSDLEIQSDTIFGTAITYYPWVTGSVFRVFTDGTGFEVLKTFSQSSLPSFIGVNVWGNTLFGLTTLREGQNLASVGGQIFRMGVNGSSFTRLKELGGTDGERPSSGLTQVGDWLYGVTSQGGSSGEGVTFKVKSDGSEYTVLKSFGYMEAGWGRWPHGELETDATDPNDTAFNLYGVTQSGGEDGGHGGGIIYRMNHNGGSFQVLTNLDAYASTNDTGSLPLAGLLRAGNTLYGTARDGGPHGRGTVFKLNTDGTGFTVLTGFPGYGGNAPRGRLVLVGNTLYGTTSAGGDFNFGTVFKVNTDGTGFATLKSFTSSEQGIPRAGLAVVGDKLYGAGNVVVFRMNFDGSDFTVLKNFSGDGISWLSALTLSGGSFYGASRHGGPSGFSGVVYKLNPDGSPFEIIHTFAAANGWQPESPVIVSGGDIYGTTSEGGPGGRGVVYRIRYSEETPIASSQSGNGAAVLDGVNGPTNLVGYHEWQSGQPWQETRLAIQFPLPISLDPAAIQSATLRLFYVGDSGAGLEGAIRAHQLLQSWNNIPGSVFPAYGSNFTAAAVPAIPVNTWISWDVTDAARNWAADPSSNHGLLLAPAPDSPTNNYYKFATRNHPNSAWHPFLELVYRNPTQHVGTVTMTITPPESLTAGAQWRMDGGNWLDSDSVITNVPAGNHQIDFKSVVEWFTPDPITVRVIGSKVASNSVTYLSNPLVGYNVGQIPTQYIHGLETKGLKVLNPLGGPVDIYGYNPYPGSAWNWSAATGIAQYTPTTTNFPPFSVTFGYYNGPTLVQQVVYFVPSSNLPPGKVEISFSGPLPPPGDEEAKYLRITGVTNAPKSFNHQIRPTRSIEVAGKTVVFQQGHTNGLYEAYNEKNDIENLVVHAETMIVRSPLRLPQTDVTLYARELRFEGVDSHIETTPRSLTTRPWFTVAGQNGLDAGGITVFVESLTNQSVGPMRFVLNGGDGQPGGLGWNGVRGTDKEGFNAGGGISTRHTTALHVSTDYYWMTDPILQLSIYIDHEDHYYPNSGSVFSSYQYDRAEYWQPGNGANAVAGGKPGSGGAGGWVTGNLRLVDYIANPGGNSAIQTHYSGGEPGTPQPAHKVRETVDEYYLLPPVFPFPTDPFMESRSWAILDSHVAQAGWNASSPSADFEVGPGGKLIASGHPLSWLSPRSLSLVFTNAEDAYLRGYFAEAEEVLADYDSLLTRYQTDPEWQQLSGSWQTEFINLLAAIQALRQRIASNTVNLGSNLTLTATSSGTEPLAYQWLFNGAAIAGATNASLTLSDIGSARQGLYQAVITNDYGSITSNVAAVNLNLPPDYNKLKADPWSGGTIRLSYVGDPGQSYALDQSASLFPANWIGQVTNVAGYDGRLIITNAPGMSSMNFWRIRAVP